MSGIETILPGTARTASLAKDDAEGDSHHYKRDNEAESDIEPCQASLADPGRLYKYKGHGDDVADKGDADIGGTDNL